MFNWYIGRSAHSMGSVIFLAKNKYQSILISYKLFVNQFFGEVYILYRYRTAKQQYILLRSSHCKVPSEVNNKFVLTHIQGDKLGSESSRHSSSRWSLVLPIHIKIFVNIDNQRHVQDIPENFNVLPQRC